MSIICITSTYCNKKKIENFCSNRKMNGFIQTKKKRNDKIDKHDSQSGLLISNGITQYKNHT